ncbi:uncharacterized protein LOC132257338 [Phlebotomus argentipes]|uniref:uncharacterized protein LOC132257338 n=1 Tax=Phlebotomus argentipes TaxID=94469 RepID=UPI00289341BC|nr:uncharacterized protein LOC132257338 [Phlebotomus argentipes]
MTKDHTTYATATFYTETPPSSKSEPSEDEERKTSPDEETSHKYESLFASFSNHLRILDEELCIEKNYRNVQLTEIITALLSVEAKLRREQKRIKQKLSEKDEQISYQLNEIENYKIARRLCSKCSRSLSSDRSRDVETQTERQQEDFKIENINHRVTITTINNENEAPQTTNCIYVSGESDDRMQRLRPEKPKPPIAKIRTVKPLANCEEIPAAVEQPEVTDDWYSSSDIEDNECLSTNLYDRSVNPVLECVNQILLQQSIEGNLESTRSYDEVKPRRVQFSTQNCLVAVPSNHAQCEKEEEERLNGREEAQATENEYEFIGSEVEKESSLYVDMDRKSFQAPARSIVKTVEPAKTPPALPPKPANLMKFRKVMKPNKVLIKVSTPVKQLAVEPDYCSIASVSEKSKSDCDDFESIPKLPNVAAILVPKRADAGSMGRFINKDNYVTKTVMNIQSSATAKEPNNNVNNKSPNQQVHQSVVEIPFSAKIFEERIPIQAEFDWYNLDAEYGKFNQADVIKETSDSSETETAVSIIQSPTDRYYMRNPIAKQAIVSGGLAKKAGSEVHLC